VNQPNNFISYVSEASKSNCSQPQSGNATSEICVTTFDKENGARQSLELGSRHVEKDKSTVWTVTAYHINTHGKNELRPEGKSLPESVVIRLMEPYLRTERNVTTDNFFTPLKLAKRLKAMQTSVVDTVKRTRKEIPAVVCDSKESLHSSKILQLEMSGTTVIVYQEKTHKNVLVFRTQHSNVSGVEKNNYQNNSIL
ncbi:hypothetical protein ILUMI_14721, partial [Ignelater luminosus]